MVLTNPDSGRRHVHPAASIANAAAQQLLRYAQEFGLTPSAEHRLVRTNLTPGRQRRSAHARNLGKCERRAQDVKRGFTPPKRRFRSGCGRSY